MSTQLAMHMQLPVYVDTACATVGLKQYLQCIYQLKTTNAYADKPDNAYAIVYVCRHCAYNNRLKTTRSMHVPT